MTACLGLAYWHHFQQCYSAQPPLQAICSSKVGPTGYPNRGRWTQLHWACILGPNPPCPVTSSHRLCMLTLHLLALSCSSCYIHSHCFSKSLRCMSGISLLLCNLCVAKYRDATALYTCTLYATTCTTMHNKYLLPSTNNQDVAIGHCHD